MPDRIEVAIRAAIAGAVIEGDARSRWEERVRFQVDQLEAVAALYRSLTSREAVWALLTHLQRERLDELVAVAEADRDPHDVWAVTALMDRLEHTRDRTYIESPDGDLRLADEKPLREDPV